MGNIASALTALSNVFCRERSVKVLMVGLDAAGKTTLLYKLRLGDLVRSVPTIGFNLETVEYKNVKFMMWDIGGQDKLRPVWKTYFAGTDGIIFVVDSNDRERVELARSELQKLTTDDALSDASLLVLANKQDLPHAMSPAELMDVLGLRSMKLRDWHIQGTCAATGEGLYEGMDWMSSTMKRR